MPQDFSPMPSPSSVPDLVTISGSNAPIPTGSNAPIPEITSNPTPSNPGIPFADAQSTMSLPPNSFPPSPGVQSTDMVGNPVSPILSDKDYIDSQARENNVYATLEYGIPGLLASVVDTTGRSVGILDKNSMPNLIKSLGFPGLSDYYTNHREGLNLTSDLLTFLIPATYGAKAITTGSWLYKLTQAEKLPLLQKLFTSTADTSEILQTVINKDLITAGNRGIQFVANDPLRTKIVSNIYATGIADAAKKYIGSEAAMYLTMNQSQTFYPDDWQFTDYVVNHAMFGGAILGMEAASLRAGIRRSLQTPEIEGFAKKAINPLGFELILPTENNRDGPATQYAMSAIEQYTTSANADNTELKTNANRYYLGWLGDLKNALGGMLKDGIPGVITPNATNDRGVVSIMKAAENDPSVLIGMQTFIPVPTTPEGLNTVRTSLSDAADKLDVKLSKMLPDADGNLPKNVTSEQVRELTAQRDRYRSYEIVGITPSGDVRKAEDMAVVFQNFGSMKDIKTIPATNTSDKIFQLNFTDPYTKQKGTLGVTDGLLPLYPTGYSWTDLSQGQQSAMYALGQKVKDAYVPGRTVDNLIAMNEKTSPFELNLAYEIIKSKPQAVKDFSLPQAAKGNELNWLYNQWLQNSYEQTFVPMMDKFVQEQNLGIKLPPGIARTMDGVRYATNMPTSYLGDAHPAFKLFRDFYMQGDRSLKTAIAPDRTLGINLEHFNGMMKETSLPPGATVTPTPDELDFLRSKTISAIGDGFHYPVDETGEFLPAQLAFLKPQRFDLTVTAMQQAALQQKLEFMQKFTNAPGLVKNIADQVTQNAAFPIAKQVDTIVDGMQAGRGYLTPQAFATRDIKVFTAVDMLSQIMESSNYKFQQDIWNPHRGTFQALQSNGGAKASFAQFAQARRYGFELAPETAEGDTRGFVKFVLKQNEDDKGQMQHTDRNISAWKRAFGQEAELPEGDVYLPDIYGTTKNLANGSEYMPLQVHPDAFNAISAFRDISKTLWDHANFFRNLYGRPTLAYQEWHLPPQNLSNKYIKYIISPAEEGQPEGIKTLVTGNSASEVEKKLQTPAMQNLIKRGSATAVEGDGAGMPSLVVDQNDMHQYFDLNDDAFFNMLDMSDGLAQTGKNTGAMGTPLFEYGDAVLKDMLKGTENQIAAYSRRTMSSLFQDQINYARMADTVSGVHAGEPRGTSTISIWKQYTSRLLGLPSEPVSKSVINAEVPLINKYWSKALETTTEIMKSASTALQKNPAAAALKDYKSFKDELGDHLPFSNAAEFMENTFKIRTPKSFEDMSGALNAITSNSVLRILELGNGVMAILGNFVSMPLVMNSMYRNSKDTDASWAARTGFMGAFGGDYKAPNSVRMAVKGVTYLMREEGSTMLKEAVAMGNMDAIMAKEYRILHQPFETRTKANINKMIDALSWVSDKGEQASRVWAYSTGYQLAQLNGVTNKFDAHSIANLFANNVIANYRSVNKPLIFQGALGSPLGMFQSFMYNYYGRLFSYIENKDLKRIAMNYALQGSLFGMQSVPGWNQFQSMYSWAYDGKKDIVDTLDNAYGHATTDVLLSGTFSNIPRIFTKDGIALYSRGDTNLSRVPAFISPENAPIISFSENLYGLLHALFDQVRTGGNLSPQRTLEIIGTYSVNRPIARLAELAAGVSADKQGNLINSDTRTLMSGISRGLGMRPLIEQKNIETNARLETTQGYQEAINNRIGSSLKGLIRSNPSSEALSNGIARAISTHLSQGGSPFDISDYIRSIAISSQLQGNQKKIFDLLNSPGRVNDLLRLVNNMMTYQGSD